MRSVFPRRMSRNFVLDTLLFIWAVRSGRSFECKPGHKVILLMIDGLRWDNFGLDLLNLNQVAETGVHADWMNGVYPTMTIPSTYSIATGLYPESHGAVHNLYFNKSTHERTYKFQDTVNVTEWFDTGVEPIWVTAKKAGKKVGSIMYVGSSNPINEILSDRVVPLAPYHWEHYSQKERVEDAVSWMKDENFDLILLYFNDPDFTLHESGLDGALSISTIFETDKEIGYLFKLLQDEELSEDVSVIIASDHGHIEEDPRKYIRLYDYITSDDLEFLVADYGPIFQAEPKEGKLGEVYNALRNAHPALHVYKKEEFPERLHYGNNERNLAIIGFVDPTWHLHTRWNPSAESVEGSSHGYDNKWMSMKSSFYAKGPFFKEGYRVRTIESVDIYQMICDLMCLQAAPNNGSREHYWDMFKSSDTTLESSIYLMLLTSVILWSHIFW